MIWQRGDTTSRRDDHDEQSDSPAGGIGRLLREAREERGLDLLTVHDRLDRPITHLEALEKGDLDSLPDQALALSTLRRYAAFLGLDGDALALEMIDAWTDHQSGAPDTALLGAPGAAQTPLGLAATQAVPAAVTAVVTTVTTEPEHLRAFTQTGEVPRAGAGSAAGGSAAYGYGTSSGAPTGTFPVVPRQEIRHSKRAVAKARRRLRAPTWLKVVTWLALVLVIVTAVGFGIQKWRPEWLVRSHILRVGLPTHPSAGGGAGNQPHQASPVVLSSFTSQSASYTVATHDFTVAISTSGRCWVQVTSSESAVPLVSGVQAAGQLLRYRAKGTMTVQVGASAVAVGVSVGGKPAYINSPKVTPYTYSFAPLAGT